MPPASPLPASSSSSGKVPGGTAERRTWVEHMPTMAGSSAVICMGRPTRRVSGASRPAADASGGVHALPAGALHSWTSMSSPNFTTSGPSDGQCRAAPARPMSTKPFFGLRDGGEGGGGGGGGGGGADPGGGGTLSVPVFVLSFISTAVFGVGSSHEVSRAPNRASSSARRASAAAARASAAARAWSGDAASPPVKPPAAMPSSSSQAISPSTPTTHSARTTSSVAIAASATKMRRNIIARLAERRSARQWSRSGSSAGPGFSADPERERNT